MVVRERLVLILFFSLTTYHCHCSHQLIQESTQDPFGDVRKQSRFFSLSTGSKIYGELLVSMPLTIFLPSLIMKRSLQTESAGISNATTTLERMLETLGLSSLECQQRFICESMQDPKKFQPISDIFYLILRDESPKDDRGDGGGNGSRRRYDSKNFPHFRQAFVAGRQKPNSTLTNSANHCCCQPFLKKCKYEGEQMPRLDFSVLDYWQKLSDIIPMTITV